MRPRPTATRRIVPALLGAMCAVALASAHLSPAGAVAAPGSAPSAVTAPAQASPVPVGLGDRGPSVAAWQREINILAGRGLVVDGIFGSGTENATIDFQRLFGLAPTGAVDTETRDVMAYLIAVTQPGYTPLGTRAGVAIHSFRNVGAYCFELRVGPAFSLECSDVSSGQPISSQVIELGHPATGSIEPVMVGTIDPIIDSVRVDTADGRSLDAPVTRNAAGLDRDLWASPVRATEVAVVRALAGDGSEVRRIVVEDTDDYLVLELGDRGPAVSTWQLRLNDATGAGIARTGIFGAATWQATVNFQRFFGLNVDGIVGPTTREVMEFIQALQRQG